MPGPPQGRRTASGRLESASFQGTARRMGDLKKRILAIHAHPDDVEFQCAGTLLLLKERGCHIIIATMTPGDCGSAEMNAEKIAETRRAEGKRAADILGAEFHCLEFRDLQIVHDNP